MRYTVLWILSFFYLCQAQSSEKGILFNRRPRPIHQSQSSSSPCWSGHSDDGYDPVDEDIKGRKFLLAAGAAVGGAALGYHIGMSQQHQNQPIINNNIYNEYPPPCVIVQGGHGSGGGGGGGILGGGGLLGHHPILSNIIQGNWGGGNGVLGGGPILGGGGGGPGLGNRQNGINWNRAARQFNRLVRPITRLFRK